MKIFYDKELNCFYDDRIHKNIPTHCIEITIEKHTELLDGQSEGKQIQPNASGYPVLVDVEVEEFIPDIVTMRQARLALHAAGLLSQVDTVIDSMEEPEKTAAKIEWEYALELKRSHPLVASLSSSLGLSETDIDNLFIQASQL